MIAGETESIIDEDFDLMQYDPDTLEDELYDDFLFGSKAKRAERRAKRQERKKNRRANKLARRIERRNSPKRIARRERSQTVFGSLGGVQGISSAIEALIKKPNTDPSIGTIPEEEDYSISIGKRGPDPETTDNTTMYMVIGGAAIAGVIVLAVMQSKKNA